MNLPIHDLHAAWPFVLAIGVLVGLAQSLFGLGGGVVMIPCLPLVFAMEPRQAVATSLVTMAPVALLNSLRVLKRGEMDWRRALRTGAFSMMGSALAAKLSAFADGRFLLGGFACATGWMAYQALFKSANQRRSFGKAWDVSVGIGAGLTSGFVGVSGGVVIMPYLNRIRELEISRVVPTSIGALTMTSVGGAMAFALERGVAADGLFSYSIVGMLVIAAVFSSQIGIQYQSKVPQRIKLAVVGTLLIGLTIRSLYRALTIS